MNFHMMSSPALFVCDATTEHDEVACRGVETFLWGIELYSTGLVVYIKIGMEQRSKAHGIGHWLFMIS